MKIKRLFIANRGEVARRIAETARRFGIESVAVTGKKVPPAFLSEAVSFFVTVEKENTPLYLNPQAMIDLALKSGCDSLHPGFGFLSENADFAAQVTQAGLLWVGPNPGAIDAMASKARARQLAQEAKVPVVPGIHDLKITGTADDATVERIAKLGFPLLIKAALGGGGKGMRVVRKKDEIASYVTLASREALSSFGDGSLIVERYLEKPRHVEVQVLGDKHGTVAILGDRDCSLQRRHQKVIEEAPAPGLPPTIREQLHEAARRLATLVKYDNAGTVEFLYEASSTGDGAFYFLEMNTRLQVEHPVTEEVFGLDLVEWQLRVACGEKLEPSVLQLKPRGHSVEARIYAEDVSQDFFPAPGAVRAFLTHQARGLRWEVGMDALDEVTADFDPMIGKLVATAATRETAIQLLAQGLKETLLVGPKTNIPFLLWLCEESAFAKAPQTTAFIKDHLSSFFSWEKSRRERLEEQWQLQNLRWAGAKTHARLDEEVTWQAFNAKPCTKSAADTAVQCYHLVNEAALGKPLSRVTRWLKGEKAAASKGWEVHWQRAGELETWWSVEGHQFFHAHQESSRAGQSQAAATDPTRLIAPVPGKVIAIVAAAGELLEEGKTVVILESMKMQFEVKTSRQCSIDSLNVKIGDQVDAGSLLVVLKLAAE